MRQATIDVYTYEELSDKAKEAVRERINRWDWEDGTAAERMEFIWRDMLTEEGWENLSDLKFGLYVQGGDPKWHGDITTFERDGAIFYVKVRTEWRGGWDAWSVEVDYGDGFEEPEYRTPAWEEFLKNDELVRNAVKDYLSELQTKLTRAFEEEDAYLMSDERISELCEANEYEFTEEGEPF